jgi:DNA-binding NtrC family response regulator
VRINVRIISATNRNPEAEVAAGRFRGDLYFRLNVLQIKLPPLRERRKDIPALARHFIGHFAARESRPLRNISPEALGILMHGQWPGNVRELENVLYRAMILSEKDTLEADDLLPLVPVPAENRAAGTPENCLSLLNHNGHMLTLDEIECAAMQFSLAHNRNNVTRAARALGVAKSTFYRKLREFQGKKN